MKYKTLEIVDDFDNSGVYFEEDVFPGRYLEGYTVGCQSCCNAYEDVTEADLDSHIESLEAALAKARAIKAEFFA